ncbi:DUF4080 domain-containing protein [Catenibacterium mitsuokai]|uniref:DUF4080 domain-containing protein n=1 Tax=Catenibacterium mitsuokai TaxID=100886 RepID=UPI002925F78E|nr:tail collar fiber protein [uncultured phage]
MAWSLLPTNYTDAVWNGLKKYTKVDNADGTVSFNDVTAYTNKETSFFGAKDANKMNGALNYIMSMLENGTDLYEEFSTYFDTQKKQFKTSGDASYNELKQYYTVLKANGDASLDTMEKDYQSRMNAYESEQKNAFNTWFGNLKNQLSTNVAGNLQNQCTELDERLAALERMTIQNEYSAPIVVNESGSAVLLVDDDGDAIVADWKYREE